MIYSKKNILLVMLLLGFFVSCENTETPAENSSITHHSTNTELVMIRNVEALQSSDDSISQHVDSILTGKIDAEFVSTGHQAFDINSDAVNDLAFEILDLQKLNPHKLPESFDSLAARVIPYYHMEIQDHSTYGYPNAISTNEIIDENANWSDKLGVLGTFMNAGNFQGAGEKYLGIRFFQDEAYHYGWIKLYCSAHSDTLRIIEFAYNNMEEMPIKAGQKE